MLVAPVPYTVSDVHSGTQKSYSHGSDDGKKVIFHSDFLLRVILQLWVVELTRKYLFFLSLLLFFVVRSRFDAVQVLSREIKV